MSETVIVTGGSSGIGLAVAEAFRRHGKKVVSVDRSPSSAAHHSVVGDVRDWRPHQEAVAEATKIGTLTALVANAGMHDGGLDLEEEPSRFAHSANDIVTINVVGYLLAIHAAAKQLRKNRGSIVLTLSDAAFTAGHVTGAGIAYTASKHAGRGILAWAAAALAPEVRVNAVAPGGIVTNLAVPGVDRDRPRFTDPAAQAELIRSRNPLGTVQTPEEIAELYLFLCSAACRAMTGQSLRSDGGHGL
ncbi:SDR family NAD(P)-dependent oxidoreductase [Nocardioides sp. AN3]